MKKPLCWILFLLFVSLVGYSGPIEKGVLTFSDSTSHSIETEQLYSESYIMNSFASRLYLNKGIYRMKEGNYELAIHNFHQALKLNPGSFEAYSLLGEAMVALELKSEAMKAFDSAIDLNPFYADAYFHRANLFQTIGKFKEAYQDYTIATYIDPIYIHAFRENDADFFLFKKITKNELRAGRK